MENYTRHQASAQYAKENDRDFYYSKRIIELLFELPRPSENIYQELLEECRRIYHKDKVQLKAIDTFEKEYDPSKAIWWYTKDSFVYRLVNMALRTENILIMLKFRFVLQDIYQQLQKMSDEQHNASFGTF